MVWSLFPSADGAQRDFLYRQTSETEFIIVSKREPIVDPRKWTIRMKPYHPKLVQGQLYGFSLRINSVISVSQPGRAKSIRVNIFGQTASDSLKDNPDFHQDRALDWLEPKLRRCGFEMSKSRSTLAHYGGLRLDRGRAADLKLPYVDIEGVIRVAEPAECRDALFSGIGRGRAFGLGLLLIRPLT